eukprot:GHVQ01033007.1.p1 GENE.GHVQ01033007.1~~GHVQ01033007.1.p1  ORF type:complete len:612 (+),score=53.41 GHVQ01033007.1:267-2102(+)
MSLGHQRVYGLSSSTVVHVCGFWSVAVIFVLFFCSNVSTGLHLSESASTKPCWAEHPTGRIFPSYSLQQPGPRRGDVRLFCLIYKDSLRLAHNHSDAQSSSCPQSFKRLFVEVQENLFNATSCCHARGQQHYPLSADRYTTNWCNLSVTTTAAPKRNMSTVGSRLRLFCTRLGSFFRIRPYQSQVSACLSPSAAILPTHRIFRDLRHSVAVRRATLGQRRSRGVGVRNTIGRYATESVTLTNASKAFSNHVLHPCLSRRFLSSSFQSCDTRYPLFLTASLVTVDRRSPFSPYSSLSLSSFPASLQCFPGPEYGGRPPAWRQRSRLFSSVRNLQFFDHLLLGSEHDVSNGNHQQHSSSRNTKPPHIYRTCGEANQAAACTNVSEGSSSWASQPESQSNKVAYHVIVLNRPLPSYLPTFLAEAQSIYCADGGTNRLFDQFGNHLSARHTANDRDDTTISENHITANVSGRSSSAMSSHCKQSRCINGIGRSSGSASSSSDGGHEDAEIDPKTNEHEGRLPTHICGDLDSIRPEVLELYRRKDVEIVGNSGQKDNDFDKCWTHLKESLKPGEVVLVVGGIGGRFDQTVKNISTLYEIDQQDNDSSIAREVSSSP